MLYLAIAVIGFTEGFFLGWKLRSDKMKEDIFNGHLNIPIPPNEKD